MRVSIRAVLAAGLSVTAVSVPVSLQVTHPTAAAPAVALTAAVSPLVPAVDGAAAAQFAPVADPQSANAQAVDAQAVGLSPLGTLIVNTYEAVQPWVAYGFELVQWAMGFVPGLWWLAPGVALLYNTVQPIVESSVLSFAYLVSGEFSQIGPELRSGIDQAVTNFVQFGIQWLQSLIPFPPFPPLPPFPFAAASVPAGAVTRAAASIGAADAATGIDQQAGAAAEPTAGSGTPDVAPSTGRAASAEAPAPEEVVAVTARSARQPAQPSREPAPGRVRPAAAVASDQHADPQISTQPDQPADAGQSQDTAAPQRAAGKAGAGSARTGR